MKKFLIPLTLLMTTSFMGSAQNPFFEDFKGAHETAPFSAIDNSHWMPAIDRGIEMAQQEIDAITKQRSTPDFDNTIVALERVGADLNRVLNVFFPLLSLPSRRPCCRTPTTRSRSAAPLSRAPTATPSRN